MVLVLDGTLKGHVASGEIAVCSKCDGAGSQRLRCRSARKKRARSASVKIALTHAAPSSVYSITAANTRLAD